MALVSVSGACSRSGKTALAVTLLRSIPERTAVALKFTTTEDAFERCPRGAPCVVCDIDVPYRIVTDEATLRRPGTDTDRLAEAGAGRVVWCIARRSAAQRAWAEISRSVGGAELVVMEGSTVVHLAHPDLHLFVAHPFLSPARWKDTSGSLIHAAEAVVVNVPSREHRRPSAAVMKEIERHRSGGDVKVADVTQPLAKWAPDLLIRFQALRAAAAEARAWA